MSHFAEIGLDNKVLRVIVVSNNELLDENHIEQESKGADFCRSLFGGIWLQTSYNGNMRKNFAGVGYTYDTALDAFIPPKPFDSWTLYEETCQWKAPVPMPDDGNKYTWNEETQTWDQINA
jgi:hypothetical protein